jgi:hypothetical protein
MEDVMKTISKTAIGICFAGIAASGCVAVPVGSPDGDVTWEAVPLPVAPLVMANAPFPAAVPARLYPTNDLARQVGMLNGTVTNLRNGKGRFQLPYRGDMLTGEATRASSGDAHNGVANAYGPRGTFMNCQYRMNNPRQGSGTCTFSDGATYDVHLGS